MNFTSGVFSSRTLLSLYQTNLLYYLSLLERVCFCLETVTLAN